MDVKTNLGELLATLNANYVRAAYDEGTNFSTWLDKKYPKEKPTDLDAFERLLKLSGIRVNSDPESGVWADTYDKFEATEATRTLATEWFQRKWRSVSLRAAPYLSQDDVLGTIGNPWTDVPGYRTQSRVAPAIPLASLIALTTGIGNDAYRAYFLTPSTAADYRMTRVTETAEIPRVKITGAQQTVRLYKYGVAIEESYEAMRRQRIDKIGFWIGQLAAQTETDKVATVIDVLVNGDGNTNSATSYNLTTLDSDTTANNLTVKAWLAFKMKFTSPYMGMVALAQEDIALKMLLLNSGSANLPLATVPYVTNFLPINPGLSDGTRLGWTSDAPANKILLVDPRFGVERVYETGANISEVERFITRQTTIMTMTEVEGYAILDKSAAKIMAVNA